MKMMKKITTALLFGALSISAFSFLISDITFDQEIGGNGYKEYKITNDGKAKTIYKVSMVPLDDPKSIEGMTVYPKVLTVEPGTPALLKIFGGDKVSVPNGEYRFMLSFKPIVVPTLRKNQETGKISGGIGTGIVPDIEMRGHVGYIDYSQELKIENLEFKRNKEKNEQTAVFNIKNNSYGGITVGALYYDNGKRISFSERVGRIGAGQTIPVSMKLKGFSANDEVRTIQFYYTNADRVIILTSYDVKTGEYAQIQKETGSPLEIK